MAKQRASVQKRQREMDKRDRERRKAAKAALKRERRLNRDGLGADATPDDADAAPEVERGDTHAVE